jgi:CheY-like chemotaxis protein
VANRFDTATALQRILTDAIASLKPPAGEPPQSPCWQIYEPLFYRYVEQLSAEEVADQLGIGTRHLRRWQSTAQEALADLLWKQFGLGQRLCEDTADVSPAGRSAADAAVHRQELAWLKEDSGASATDLGEVLPAVLDVAQKLAGRHNVCLGASLADSLPKISVPSIGLRQTLINLLSVVIPRASGGRVSFTVRPLRWDVEICVRCSEYASGPRPPLEDESDNLNMAQQLADLCGFGLSLAADARCFNATLTLPALEQIPVLAIDDSADALQLLQRYMAGTRYRLIGTRDPEQALELAEKIAPQIILLDVMMPHVDGWELLGRLRAHPLTGEVPVIVCTILAQRDLALLLGASDFLRKPFTRGDFLAALDRQMDARALAPR